MKTVACVGILVADIIVKSVKDYPKKGELLPVNSITLHSGGNAMTASINLKKMGVETKIIGMVGNDFFGDYLRKCLNISGVDTSGLKEDGSTQTSASVLMIDESGERSFFHCVGTNATFDISDIDFEIIKTCDYVFVTGTFLLNNFDGKQTADFLKKCKELGKTTFLDVCWDASDKWGELLFDAMPYIDFFMPSIDEAVCISKQKDIEEIANVFMQKGVKNVVVKMGSKGSYLRKQGEKTGGIFPCIKGIEAVDTTGAGDSFCSGFLAALSRGESLEKCMEFANAVGALCVTQKGATTGIRTYEETIAFMGEKKC